MEKVKTICGWVITIASSAMIAAEAVLTIASKLDASNKDS